MASLLEEQYLDQANTYARKTEPVRNPALKTRKARCRAAICRPLSARDEVEAQVLAAKGTPALAEALLRRDLLAYRILRFATASRKT